MRPHDRDQQREIEAAAAYRDPWLEREHPHEPTQFAGASIVAAEAAEVRQ